MGRRTHQKKYEHEDYSRLMRSIGRDKVKPGQATHAGTGEISVVEPVAVKTENLPVCMVAEAPPAIFAGEVVNPMLVVKRACELADFTRNRYIANARRIQQINSRLVDIQHEIEMQPPKNTPSGYRVYREQRDILRERRIAKDENAILEPIKALIDKHAEVFDEMANVLNQIENITQSQVARKYHYRAPELLKEESTHE